MFSVWRLPSTGNLFSQWIVFSETYLDKMLQSWSDWSCEVFLGENVKHWRLFLFCCRWNRRSKLGSTDCSTHGFWKPQVTELKKNSEQHNTETNIKTRMKLIGKLENSHWLPERAAKGNCVSYYDVVSSCLRGFFIMIRYYGLARPAHFFYNLLVCKNKLVKWTAVHVF